MSTKNNKDLIKDLTDDLKPVKPLMGCYPRILMFILASYCLVFGAIVWFGFRSDISVLYNNHALLIQLFLLLIAGLMATAATFRLAVPCEHVGKGNYVLIGMATAIIIGVSAYCAMMGDPNDLNHLNQAMIWGRIKRIALISLLPTLLMVYMMRRARPVHASLVGFSSFMAISSLSVTGCKLSCPIDSLYINLVWHYLPIIVISVLGYIIGRYLYKWS